VLGIEIRAGGSQFQAVGTDVRVVGTDFLAAGAGFRTVRSDFRIAAQSMDAFFTGGKPLKGLWFNRTGEHAARN